ncbi:3-oxoacyl-ACP synthase [Flavobacterium sp.]|uniref:3-oxoacyl-ACP synthase n=1 Tax=Flavobacterium sp. TaxID=239 RepID=UPI0025E894E2|nr:3-oxoacyl-ACP synthase [Flavobacterium sp.]
MIADKTYIQSYCTIQNNKVTLNGEMIFESESDLFSDFSKKAYQYFEINYPKFFKMDDLSKLAFLAAELLLKNEMDGTKENNIALVFANASSSLDTDVKYQNSINDKENYYPSPAVFVYTLPNICLGEISIRHQLKSENSFFIFAEFNPLFTGNYANLLLKTKKADKVLCGWVDFYKEEYKAFLYLVSNEGTTEHNEQTLKTFYNK